LKLEKKLSIQQDSIKFTDKEFEALMGFFSDDDDSFDLIGNRNFKRRSQRKVLGLPKSETFDLSKEDKAKIRNGLFRYRPIQNNYQKFDRSRWGRSSSHFNQSKIPQSSSRNLRNRLFTNQSRHDSHSNPIPSLGRPQIMKPKQQPFDKQDGRRRVGPSSSYGLNMRDRFNGNRNQEMNNGPESSIPYPDARSIYPSMMDYGNPMMEEEHRHHGGGPDPSYDFESVQNSAQLANFSQIDQAGLIRSMHKRFLIKAATWESLAFMYSRLSFGMHFIILVIQVLHILSQHFAEMYKFEQNKVHTVQFCCSALTAVIAGLQMKLKMHEKCEKYRRGAKMYARLKRATTYCLLLIDNGGKIEDVSTLWKEAMSKEAKSIPIANMFMST